MDIAMPNNTGFKSYMSYKTLSKESSPQYKLQEMCSTDENGIRNYYGRYAIAIGSGANCKVGDYVDLILANGEVIRCVVGDFKANIHTDETNLIGNNGCCSEFIVDTSELNSQAKIRGDMSYCNEVWNSPVVYIRKYNLNIVEGKDES